MQAAPRALDVLIVSLGSTRGLRTADDELRDSLVRAGARVAIARAIAPASTRTLMLTDLGWARAARAAAIRALADMPLEPRAIVYSSTTAALLWPRPGAIRFDAPSAGNRPGRHGLWQRPLERRRLERAPLLLPWSAAGLGQARAGARAADRTLVVPVAVEASGAPERERDIAAITYAANPIKKGFDRVLEAWRRVRGELPPGVPDELVVAGASDEDLEKAGLAAGEDGVRVVGALAQDQYRALLRRARVFVCAPRREDYGIAQLEALADGCLLVSTPAPGPYVALSLALSLDPRLVSEDLEGALRTALCDPRGDYAARASDALAPFSRAAVDRVVADRLLGRLLDSC
ncbi:MAG TPA: glycosyltransferase [Solirubrobacteraceae bacterium]|jgi:glycosyltransferase involved in cell wall biosynthesis|nr:glycosyltransferase [Solirubrobacteraceae bacterium]